MDRPLTLGTLMQLHLLLSLCSPALQVEVEVRTVVGEDCVLRCMAPVEPGVQYRAVTWYKESSANVSGLLTRQLPDGEPRRYVEAEQRAELLDGSHDIVLHNVTCGDSAVYSCHLAAPVGEQNQDGRVHLTVIGKDCSTGSSITVVKETHMVIIATATLILALLIFLINYVKLRKVLRGGGEVTKKVIFKDATLAPLDKEDLKLIYTLGPKKHKPLAVKQMWV